MRIALERITVERAGRRALDDVSVELAPGAITAVIGPSGAGKSTLLGVLAGLTAPRAGRVLFDGEEVTALLPERRRLGVVFQDLRLFDFLSGRDNVAFAPRVAAVGDPEQRRRVDEALAQMRAVAFADRPAGALSGGERQRIAIARALAARPRALLFDEPFASLDAALRRGVRDELGALVRALGLTAVVVTHDRDDAFALASHLVVLREGRVAQVGAAAELYERPVDEYVATLLGEANLLPIEGREGAEAVRVAGRVLAATGAVARALLRPEAIVLAPDGAGWSARVLETRFAGAAWRTLLDAGPLGPLIAVGPRPPAEEVQIAPPAGVHTV
jgi:ABC-type Fe3+/spermidine/putrescine transport system ATPase subunit